MGSKNQQADSIQRYIDAAAELRDLIKQAHEVSRDLGREVKAANEIRGTLPEEAAKQIEESVAEGLAGITDSISAAIDTSERAIFRRFDKIQAILMGDEDRAKGGLDLEEQINGFIEKLSPVEREQMYTWARLILKSGA